MVTTVLVLVSSVLALAGIVLAAMVRDHVPHGTGPARLCGALAVGFAAGGAVAWRAGAGPAALPLLAAAVLSGAAAWTVMPTSRSRFAQFERQFRAYVRHRSPAERPRS